MFTSLRIRNFKNIRDAEIELGNSVVFIGPNNSGKTTALQAIALWSMGTQKWNEKRTGKGAAPRQRTGVAINRNDLIAIPVPFANLLWNDLHVRNAEKINGKQATQNIRIEITIDGITQDKSWTCGMEFDYANEESFYCRPLRIHSNQSSSPRMDVPPEVNQIKVAYLPPMSGLAAIEPKWEPGRISVLIGEGQTAQVLRNLCYQIHTSSGTSKWEELIQIMRELFGVELAPPEYIVERGEIALRYKELGKKTSFDLSSSGRGFQQTLLLFSYLYANPNSVLLIDEPDAHLEILRQRQIYNLLAETARKQCSQLIAASHSEIVLEEAGDKNVVIAFVRKPHRINKKSQVLKSLKEIGFDQYYLAEQTGWILYLEGSTDLAILKSFAERLNHPGEKDLRNPFVHYVSNQPKKVEKHFFGLREAKSDLLGVAIFDRLDKEFPNQEEMTFYSWKKREIENYLCIEEVLIAYAIHDVPDDLFGLSEKDTREKTMRECIREISDAYQTVKKPSPWSSEIKASDDFLDILFEKYFERLKLVNIMSKTHYHELVPFVPSEKIEPEIIQVLDMIHDVAQKAQSRNY